MTSTSILVLLFVVVPGFIADNALRAMFGERRLSDFDKTIRSLIFSVFGLLVYLALVRGAEGATQFFVGREVSFASWILIPPYLTAIGDAGGKTAVALDATALWPFILHASVTVGTALIWGWLSTRRFLEGLIGSRTGRSAAGTAWQLFWGRFFGPSTPDRQNPSSWLLRKIDKCAARLEPRGAFDVSQMRVRLRTQVAKHLLTFVARRLKPDLARQPRWVTVRLTGGQQIMGVLQAASDPTEDKDLVLGYPLYWNGEKEQWFAENHRYVYIPTGRIDYISLSPIGDEPIITGAYPNLDIQQPGVEK